MTVFKNQEKTEEKGIKFKSGNAITYYRKAAAFYWGQMFK